MVLALPLAVPLRWESEEYYCLSIRCVCPSNPSVHLPIIFRQGISGRDSLFASKETEPERGDYFSPSMTEPHSLDRSCASDLGLNRFLSVPMYFGPRPDRTSSKPLKLLSCHLPFHGYPAPGHV